MLYIVMFNNKSCNNEEVIFCGGFYRGYWDVLQLYANN